MNKKKIDAALMLDEASIYFLVRMSPDEATVFLKGTIEYNSMKDLAEMVKEVNGIVPPISSNPGNPNNGRLHHSYDIGNEGSRAIYLRISKHLMPEGYGYGDLSARLYDIGIEHGANESFTQKENDNVFVYRWWWD